MPEFECTVVIDYSEHIDEFKASGSSKKNAKNNACMLAIKHINNVTDAPTPTIISTTYTATYNIEYLNNTMTIIGRGETAAAADAHIRQQLQHLTELPFREVPLFMNSPSNTN